MLNHSFTELKTRTIKISSPLFLFDIVKSGSTDTNFLFSHLVVIGSVSFSWQKIFFNISAHFDFALIGKNDKRQLKSFIPEKLFLFWAAWRPFEEIGWKSGSTVGQIWKGAIQESFGSAVSEQRFGCYLSKYAQ